MQSRSPGSDLSKAFYTLLTRPGILLAAFFITLLGLVLFVWSNSILYNQGHTLWYFAVRLVGIVGICVGVLLPTTPFLHVLFANKSAGTRGYKWLRVRLYATLGTVCGVIAFLGTFGVPESDAAFTALTIFVFSLGAFSVGGTLYAYLTGRESSGEDDTASTSITLGHVARLSIANDQELLDRLDRLESSYNELLVTSTESDSKEIDIDALLRSVEQSALEQMPTKIAEELEKRFAAKVVEHAQINALRNGIDQSRMRLRDQVDASMRRSNLNLIIGILTTGLAAGILGFVTLFEMKPVFEGDNGMTHLLAHYIPRISTIIFIEVFAFFFLRLYKAGIQETRYFQNELTNIESKAAAIEGALIKEQSNGTQDIIRQLVRTDRNQNRLLDGEDKDSGLDIKALTPVFEALSKGSGKPS